MSPGGLKSYLKRIGVTTIAGWSVVIVLLAAINIKDQHTSTITGAENEARDYYRLNLFYRAWAAKMGGVYVPIASVTPNPYLQVPNRDITASDMRQFTLVNPAYMTRMVFESILSSSPDPIVNKITSLKPLNPINAPDEWERQSLFAFERKEYKERSEVTTISGKPYLRLITMFVTEESCLKCHAHQGYRAGDVRGAIVISVPLTKRFELQKTAESKILGGYFILWVIGSTAIAVSSRRRSLDIENIQRLAAIVEYSEDAIISKTPEGIVTSWNRGAEKLFGYSGEEMLGKALLNIFPADRKNEEQDLLAAIGRGESADNFETVRVRKDGSLIDVSVTLSPIRNQQGAVIAFSKVARDITERKLAEKEKLILEAQLQQAQKMESVGRLAGGVAHDFNNMLTVILGHAELGLMRLDQAHPVCADLQEISKTAERSADLTRQLLAFARKQIITPKVIDLNETVSTMLKMLQRLIGEDINLSWQPATGLWQVKMDPSQLDQILANLCVNARDAIADTGRITIETTNSSIDAQYCAANPEATPGEYVRLTISDDGGGMDRETLTHIFEPFYTTKEMGKGTGLGLATVYGAVKQNNGFINIYSEPGQGTTFSIYLPRDSGSSNSQTLKEAAVVAVPRGYETILLVEDDPGILKITAMMLEEQGYTVLKAGTPGEALCLAGENVGGIQLLMTDIIMPEMNGRDLASVLLPLHPHIRLLFMSGYTADVIAQHGVLAEGVHFIQKPFSLMDMAAMVRSVLDGR